MRTLKILAGKLFDPYELKLVPNQVITVSPEYGFIVDVQPIADVGEFDILGEDIIDLRHLTVLPGFVDAHVHSLSTSTYRALCLNHNLPQCSCIHMKRLLGTTS
jgi:cytosine/adenosine deaminase-related metal-dependent hydrolase